MNESTNSTGARAPIAEKGPMEKVMTFYMDRVNATPSHTSIEELGGFVKDIDADVIIKAMEYALDEHKSSWSYIRATLTAYKAKGIRTLADLQRANDEHQQARQRQEDETTERVEKATDQILAISCQHWPPAVGIYCT